LLIKTQGAKIGKRHDGHGYNPTPLERALSPSISVDAVNKIKTLKLLLEAGANVEVKPWLPGVRSLLRLAAGASRYHKQDLIATRLLLEYGARIDDQTWPLLPPELQKQYAHQRVSEQSTIMELE
jgi:hypothetical protein